MSKQLHRPKRSSWLFKAGLMVGATFLSLLLGEGLVRWLGAAPDVKAIHLGNDECVYRRSTNAVLGFELKPNYRHEQPDYIQNYERTNSVGQRDEEWSLSKPPGTRRILLLGDSVVEGYGLRQDETIGYQLELLCPAGQTEVLNFGVSAYCTRAEVELLEVKGLRFQPDVVVLVFVENDFDNFNREAFPLGGTIDRPAITEFLFTRSDLFRLACIQWNFFHFGLEADPVRWNQQAIGDNNVPEGLQRLRALADRYGFQPLIAIWPRFLDDRIVDVPLMPQSQDELVIERLARSIEIPAARLSAHFRRHLEVAGGKANPRLVYSSGDELHPSPTGARVAAEAIKNLVEELGQGRAAKADTEPDGRDSLAAARAAAKALGQAKPDYARVFNRLGTDLMKSGEFAEAAAQFRMALEQDPDHAGAHNNLGLALERLGAEGAQEHFIRAVELQPDFSQAHFNLSRSLLRQGRAKAAMLGLQRTIEIDPHHVGALNLLGVELGKLRDYEQARAHLERALEIEPQNAEVRNNLGVIHAAQGKLAEAIDQFQAALEADPSHARAAQNLARTKAMSGRPER